MTQILVSTNKWIIDSLGGNGVIESTSQLAGSTSSILHGITIRINNEIKEFVLRQVTNQELLLEEPDFIRHEGAALECAIKAGLNVPNLIAFDEAGKYVDTPSLLMTKLEGEVVLKPGNMDAWLDGMAHALSEIHKVHADDFHWKYFSYQDVNNIERQDWSRMPELWERAFEIIRKPRPKYRPCFIHRDFHPNNVLWDRGRLSGVIDWPGACLGPAATDVGHARVNLAQLYGVEIADKFLIAYQKYTGSSFVYDLYWDIVSLTDILFGPPTVYSGWEAFGVTDLTDQIIRNRLELYLQSLLKKLGV
jgi:aminoglycoside phosphotransferase (APT) family kinase protein